MEMRRLSVWGEAQTQMDKGRKAPQHRVPERRQHRETSGDLQRVRVALGWAPWVTGMWGNYWRLGKDPLRRMRKTVSQTHTESRIVRVPISHMGKPHNS